MPISSSYCEAVRLPVAETRSRLLQSIHSGEQARSVADINAQSRSIGLLVFLPCAGRQDQYYRHECDLPCSASINAKPHANPQIAPFVFR